MKFALNVLLFSVTIFILTAVGLAFLYYKTLVLPLWLLFAYIVAWASALDFAVDFFTGRNGKLSRKEFLLLTFGAMIISTMVTHSVWTIVTPRWSFSVSTDKSTYRLGEEVEITVCLKNMGFITHSFESRVNDPVLIFIEYQYTENPTVRSQVWCSPYHMNIAVFSIGPHESLERNFIWNQSNIYFPEREIEPGIYWIKAFVPSAWSTMPVGVDLLFWAWTSINITSI